MKFSVLKKKNEVHEHNAEKGTLFSIPQTRIHTNIIRSLQNDKNLIIIITYLEHTTTKTKNMAPNNIEMGKKLNMQMKKSEYSEFFSMEFLVNMLVIIMFIMMMMMMMTVLSDSHTIDENKMMIIMININ